MSLTVRVLLALAVGLLAGAILSAVEARADGVILAADIVGSLWLDALRMTIIPLVFSLLVTGAAAAASTAALGGVAARAVGWFAVLIVASAVFGALVTPALLAVSPADLADAEALRGGALAGAGTEIPASPPVTDWLKSIIPSNPIEAAADGAVLPLVVFALIFGVAVTRLAPELRDRVIGFFQAIGEAMLVIVSWVLWVAPLGVLALALGVGFRVGIAAAGALAHYVVIVSAVGALLTLAVYALVPLARMPFTRFVRAAVPPQVVGLSTQSSLASLPAMIDTAERNLHIPTRVTGIVLPLAVSIFRITSPAMNLAVVLYVASLYGIEPALPQLAAGAMLAAVLSLAVVSLPSQITFFTALVPISIAMGVPLEVLPLLLGVEMIPDLVRTVGNVTADLAVTSIVARRAPER